MAVASLFEKIIQFFQGKPLWIFFNIDYLRIFHEFTEIDNILLRKHESYKQINKNINRIFDSYCSIWQNNALLPMESLFKFKEVGRVQQVVKNYPTLRGDAENDIDLHTSSNHNQLGDLRDQLEGEVGDISVFMKNKLWTEQEDMVLAQNYATYIVQDKVFLKLRNLLKRTLNSDKTLGQVRKRVQTLELDRISENQAEIKIQTLHSGKLNFQRVLRSVLKPLTKDQRIEHWGTFVKFMQGVLKEFKEFKLEFPDSLTEFSIVPENEADFKAVFIFQSVLMSMDIINPQNKRAFWRMPNYVSADQISERLYKFDKIFKGLDSDLKSKAKKQKTENLDEEFGDLLEKDEFNFDVGANEEAGKIEINKEMIKGNKNGGNLRKKSKNKKPKRRLRRLKNRSSGKKKVKPENSKLKKIEEDNEIEGLVSGSDSDDNSVVSNTSSGKENVREVGIEDLRPNQG